MDKPQLSNEIKNVVHRATAFAFDPRITRTQIKGLLKIYGVHYSKMQSTMALRELLAEHLSDLLKTVSISVPEQYAQSIQSGISVWLKALGGYMAATVAAPQLIFEPVYNGLSLLGIHSLKHTLFANT